MKCFDVLGSQCNSADLASMHDIEESLKILPIISMYDPFFLFSLGIDRERRKAK